MKKLLTMILFPFLIIPFVANANENFSVEIEALTLVMEQYKEDSELDIELDLNNKKPSYLALNKMNAMLRLKLPKQQVSRLLIQNYSM